MIISSVGNFRGDYQAFYFIHRFTKSNIKIKQNWIESMHQIWTFDLHKYLWFEIVSTKHDRKLVCLE